MGLPRGGKFMIIKKCEYSGCNQWIIGKKNIRYCHLHGHYMVYYSGLLTEDWIKFENKLKEEVLKACNTKIYTNQEYSQEFLISLVPSLKPNYRQ